MSLSLHDVTVRAGEAVLLDHVSFDCAPGRITVLIGANGAGKTTALKVLAGERAADEGRAELDGAPLQSLAAPLLAMRRAVLPQRTEPAFGLKVHELIRLGRAPFGDGEETKTRHVADALDLVDAGRLAAREVESLSGGERQRACLARALAQIAPSEDDRTRYLLLDEPTSALDLKQARAVLAAVRLRADAGAGVIAALHDLAAARRYADDVIILRAGVVIAVGAPADVLTPEIIADAFDVDEATASDALGNHAVAQRLAAE